LNSLLARLLTIVVIALAPALAFQAYTEIEARHVRQRLMQDEAFRLLNLVRAEQSRIIDGAEQVLDIIAGSPAVQDNLPEFCQRLLTGLLLETPRYSHASVIALDGRPLCTPGPVAAGLNASDRAYFRLALQTGRFVIGDYTTGRTSGQKTIHMAKPVRNRDGAIIAVAEVALSLPWLEEQIEKLDMPKGSIVTIADRNGTFLARRPGGMAFVGQSVPPGNRFLLEGDRPRVFPSLFSLENGHRVMVAYAPPGADPAGFSVGVELDETETFAGVLQANLTGMVLIIAGAGLAIVLTVLAGSRLIRRPVSRLLAVAEAWRGGDLSARTGMRRDGSEFGRLAHAFDDMAAAVQARERALQATLESTNDIVLSIDRDWRLTYRNEHAVARGNGKNVVGRDFWEACPEIIGTPFETAYRRTMATGIPTVVREYYARMDAYFDAHVFPADNGISIFIRDVTEEHKTGVALRESENRLRLAREAAGFGVWDRDVAAGTLIWSDEQWRLHGLEPAPGGADMETWSRALHPEDREAMVTARLAAINEPGRPFEAEYRVVWPDGSIHWLQAKSNVTLGPANEVVRVVGFTLDVTASRETELRLRRLSNELEARVRAEVDAREVAQARAAQAERMQALGQLAGGIAHDINNVLQAASGALTLIQRRAGDEAATRRFARLASDAIDRGASVTRRLLTFGRRGDLRTENLDLGELVRSLHEILTYTLGGGVEPRVLLPDDLPRIVADKGQLETVLVNLATNARDAMPDGGELRITAEAETVGAYPPHASGLRPGHYVRLSVTDTGTGMDAATLARAREPFFTTKASGAGTGLGLPMAYGFAEQSGGALTIESEPGCGTTVTLWLPRADDGPAAAVREGARPPARDAAARVLLADDEAVIREVLARHLEDAGYVVIAAADGTEAMELLANGGPVDALVTDLSMPGMNGIALIRAVQGRLPDVPAILLTGYAEDAAALALSGELAGRVSLMRKPVTDIQLLDRLGAMLARRPEMAS
jgi:signal transduction histidine kinase